MAGAFRFGLRCLYLANLDPMGEHHVIDHFQLRPGKDLRVAESTSSNSLPPWARRQDARLAHGQSGWSDTPPSPPANLAHFQCQRKQRGGLCIHRVDNRLVQVQHQFFPDAIPNARNVVSAGTRAEGQTSQSSRRHRTSWSTWTRAVNVPVRVPVRTARIMPSAGVVPSGTASQRSEGEVNPKRGWRGAAPRVHRLLHGSLVVGQGNATRILKNSEQSQGSLVAPLHRPPCLRRGER